MTLSYIQFAWKLVVSVCSIEVNLALHYQLLISVLNAILCVTDSLLLVQSILCSGLPIIIIIITITPSNHLLTLCFLLRACVSSSSCCKTLTRIDSWLLRNDKLSISCSNFLIARSFSFNSFWKTKKQFQTVVRVIIKHATYIAVSRISNNVNMSPSATSTINHNKKDFCSKSSFYL